MRRNFLLGLVVTVIGAASVQQTAVALTPPVERDICKIRGVVRDLREVEQTLPWKSQEHHTITEIKIEITHSELAEKRTQQDSSQCMIYKRGQEEWFKLCDDVLLEKGDRIVAREGTTVGAGRYCVYDIEQTGHRSSAPFHGRD